jgi:HlyD family secretion protein
MKKIIWLLVAITLVSCSVKKGKDFRGKGGGKPHVVANGSITIKLEETGEIQPIKEFEIKSKVSGKVLKFYVEEGDYITNGQVIADIEPDYNQAETIARVKSNLKLAEIKLENSTENLKEKQDLFDKKYISADELDAASDGLKETIISYESAMQQYELIKEIETENNVSKLVASASGTIIQKPVEEGEMVVSSANSYSAGTIVLKLADLRRMVVRTHINEVDISKIKKSQKAEIKVDAYPYDKYQGEISKIAAMAITYNNIKVFPIEIEILESDDKLKPGMTANITIIGQKKEDIVVLPIRAIFSDDEGQDIVWLVKNDSISKSVPVKTGINNFQEVEIIEGLSVGDSISFSEGKKKSGGKRGNIQMRF